jgi:hypothetical protein
MDRLDAATGEVAGNGLKRASDITDPIREVHRPLMNEEFLEGEGHRETGKRVVNRKETGESSHSANCAV